MRFRTLPVYLALLAVTLFFSSQTQVLAQETEEPVVHAVLFYSPTCPHCHEAITNVIVPLLDQYGAQLAVVGIDVSTEAGQYLYTNAIKYYEVPENRRGVPTLIYQDMVLVSTTEIENEFPGLIEAALAAGGNQWPDFPGLAEVVVELTPTATVIVTPTPSPEPEMEVVVLETAVSSPAPLVKTPTSTPEHNTALSIEDIDPAAIATTETAPPPDPVGFALGWLVVLGLVVVLLFSIWKVADNWPELIQAGGVGLNHSPARAGLMWLLIGLGLIVSGYLAYVETMQITAVCGPVGECNIVQSSAYARLLGIPIAIWGSLFYLTTAVLWLLQRVKRMRHLAVLGLVGTTIFGSLFSLYLTLLELLMIGAICAWCLTSAVVTGVICLLVMTGIEKS